MGKWTGPKAKAYHAAYYQAHKERLNEQQRLRRLENLDHERKRARIRMRRWRRRHPRPKRKKRTAYERRLLLRARRHRHYERHREAILAARAARYKAHPEQTKAYWQRAYLRRKARRGYAKRHAAYNRKWYREHTKVRPLDEARLIAAYSSCRKAARKWAARVPAARMEYDDMVQAAMLQVARVGRRYKPGRASWETFVFSVADNACRHYVLRRVLHGGYRHSPLQVRHVESLEDLRETIGYEPRADA